MNINELYLHYREAIQLVKVGRYQEAYNMLAEIDQERPNTKNVLYALAVCCDMMGQTQEALDLCERLIALYDHPKARLIKARIEKAAQEPDLPQVDLVSALGIGGGPKPPATADSQELPMATEEAPEDFKAPEKPAAGWSWFKKTR